MKSTSVFQVLKSHQTLRPTSEFTSGFQEFKNPSDSEANPQILLRGFGTKYNMYCQQRITKNRKVRIKILHQILPTRVHQLFQCAPTASGPIEYVDSNSECPNVIKKQKIFGPNGPCCGRLCPVRSPVSGTPTFIRQPEESIGFFDLTGYPDLSGSLSSLREERAALPVIQRHFSASKTLLHNQQPDTPANHQLSLQVVGSFTMTRSNPPTHTRSE